MRIPFIYDVKTKQLSVDTDIEEKLAQLVGALAHVCIERPALHTYLSQHAFVMITIPCMICGMYAHW